MPKFLSLCCWCKASKEGMLFKHAGHQDAPKLTNVSSFWSEWKLCSCPCESRALKFSIWWTGGFCVLGVFKKDVLTAINMNRNNMNRSVLNGGSFFKVFLMAGLAKG